MLEPEEIDNRKDLSKVTNEPAFIETETTVKNAVDAKGNIAFNFGVRLERLR
jgi:hypothetical protein